MFKLRALSLLLLFFLHFQAEASPADPGVHYEIAFPNAIHHEAEVTVTFTGIDATHAHLNMSATFMWARGIHHLRWW